MSRTETAVAEATPAHVSGGTPRFDCPRCRDVILEAERDAGRLMAARVPDPEVLDAAHKPRFATLAEHDLFEDRARAYR